MEQVKLYDTTLRDGMQGEGMSLSAAGEGARGEGARRARRADDRGRLPELQPEGRGALRLARRARAGARRRLRLRHDPAARGGGGRRPGAPDRDRLLRAGGHPGRQDLGPPPGEGHQGLPRGEPGDDRRVGRLLPRARQAGRLRRRALLRLLPRGPRVRALLPGGGDRRRGRERHPLRHQRGEPAEPGRGGDRGRRHPLRRPRRNRHPRPRRRGLRGRQQPRRGRRRGAHGAGDGERLRRALRQRQPDLGAARAAAEDGLRRRPGRQARDADRDGPLHRRALQPDAGPERALRRPQRLRPQGRHPRRRDRGRGALLRARRTGRGRQRAGDPALGALRQGDDPRPGRARRASRSTTRPPRGRSRS